MSITALIITLAGCLLCEGFFSGSEIAIVSAERHKLALSVERKSRWTRAIHHLVTHPAMFLSTTLLGTNIFTITGSVITTVFIIHRFGEAYTPFALLYWPFTLVLGEIVPKSLYQRYADQIAIRVAPILLVVSYILFPLVWLLSKFTELLLRGLHKRYGEEPPVSRADLETMMDLDAEIMGDVKPQEKTMISRIFDLAEKKVENIMTPLVDVIAIPVDAGKEEAVRVMEEFEYTRVPIYENQIHNILGVLENEDLLFAGEASEVRNLVHPAFFVPEEMPLDNLLVAMKRRGEPMAIVVDEYGAATGIVTTEDLLEEVVGEIRDEHDEIRPLYKRMGARRYLVSGRMEIEDANERLKLDIEPGEYETVAGFIVHAFARIPRKGERMTIGKHTFIIRRASERAVHEVEITAKE